MKNTDAQACDGLILADGYESGVCHGNESGAVIELRYKTIEQAEAAFDVVTTLIDAAGVPGTRTDALIDAADKHADNYEGNDIPARDVRASICNAFYAGAKFAAAGVPPIDARKATDAEIQQWADRHDLGISSTQELRCVFEDAESHHLTRGVAPIDGGKP